MLSENAAEADGNGINFVGNGWDGSELCLSRMGGAGCKVSLVQLSISNNACVGY